MSIVDGAPPTRHELMSIAVARGQDVCVAYVNTPAQLGDAIESLFTALSRIQEHDDRHATDGPSEQPA